MDRNYSSRKLPGTGSNVGPGYPPNASWTNPSRITADDGSSAGLGLFAGGQHADALVGSNFGFQQLPDNAVIDGIAVTVDGSNTGCYGDITLSLTGTTYKDAGALSGNYGSATDLWGATTINKSEIASLTVSINLSDVSGGDGIAAVDYIAVTLYWHIEMPNVPDTDVPTRFDYKVYSRDGDYLGLLPKVTSKFGFAQDINSAGSSIQITCGQFVKNEVTTSPLLTEAGDIITTENDLPILATETELLVTTGDSPDNAIFKNSNRIQVWMHNRYYPNGKLMFSGQVNRVDLKYGGADAQVRLTVYSDGLDLGNYIARGYPFNYTTDNDQQVWNTEDLVDFSGPGWTTYGQSFTTGPAVTNIGSISLGFRGTARVTCSLYDGIPGVNGDLIASVTKDVSNPSMNEVAFDFQTLIPVSPSTQYFVAMWLDTGQQITTLHNSTSVYSGGAMYRSDYSGGSGGGAFVEQTGDLWFKTKSGLPTTTTTYTSDDPVTDMARGILLDYNSRGGYITERDFEATGLSLTYTFVVATILDALKKIIELCPTGFYSYVDLGTAEIDIKQMSTTADFTVVRGRHINELSLGLTIEQIKNYLLLSGGETAGVNLYRDYTDSESVGNYGIRTVAKSDNRVTIAATADAIGDSFIAENADEMQETTLVVKDEKVDITQFIPGKTIGFKNFGNFIDDMVLQIVRREPNFSDGICTLTLGRLPVRMNDQVQRINRELLNEQTIKNPSAPS